MPVGASSNRQQVGDAVRKLALRPALTARRAELKALGDALASGKDKDLEPWTEIDLHRTFVRRESVHKHTPAEAPYWKWLEAALGGLVFVPLLFTWYGLTEASTAYESLTEEDRKHAARPFLQLWQTGFEGHLSGWFTFGHVAGAASFAILLLLGCAVLHGARRASTERAEEAAERERDGVLADMVPVLTWAQLRLNEHRMGTPARFAADLNKGASALNRLTNKSVSAQEGLDKAAEQVSTALGSVQGLVASVAAAVRPLEEAAGRIESAVRDNGTSLNRTLGDVRSANGEIKTQLDRTGDRVEDALSTLGASQRAFTTSTEVATDVHAQTLVRIAEVAEQTAEAVTASQDSARQLAAQTDALRSSAERFSEMAVLLRERMPDQQWYGEQAPAAERTSRMWWRWWGNGGGQGNGANGGTAYSRQHQDQHQDQDQDQGQQQGQHQPPPPPYSPGDDQGAGQGQGQGAGQNGSGADTLSDSEPR